jgi:predicted RNA-binding Zn-ribbon protein involved in translation (DUF1610 family)
MTTPADATQETTATPTTTPTAGAETVPIPMFLTCPKCNARHIDEGAFATKPHHTHSCQECGMTWRPAVVPTVGVSFLPGFKNETPSLQELSRVLLHTGLDLIGDDGHSFGARPCQTCRAVSALAGRLFGCTAYAARRAAQPQAPR